MSSVVATESEANTAEANTPEATRAEATARIPVMVPWLGEEEAEAAAEAVRSGWVAQGPRVAEFERAFAAEVGAAHGVAVSSGTAALHLGLVALGVGAGDEVVVPSLSFIATANAARYVGAAPVFADIDPATGNLTPDTIAAALTSKTRAVILVHQGGVPADLDALRKFCAEHGLALLEDAACAAGARYRGAPVGVGAQAAAWSFHPRKLLTTGEGGMATTDDAEAAARMRRLREHGMNVSAADRHASTKPVLEAYLETGFNYRMTDIQAAVGLVQLRKLAATVAERREIAARYQRELAGIPGLTPVSDPEYGQSNYQSFWVRLDEEFPVFRDDLLLLLSEAGVSARRGIMAAHMEPAYADVDTPRLPATEALSLNSLILPVFHGMTDAQQDRVIAVLKAAVSD